MSVEREEKVACRLSAHKVFVKMVRRKFWFIYLSLKKNEEKDFDNLGNCV